MEAPDEVLKVNMSFLSFPSELNDGDEIVVPILKQCHLITYIENPNIIEEASQPNEILSQEAGPLRLEPSQVVITGESASKVREQALGQFDQMLDAIENAVVPALAIDQNLDAFTEITICELREQARI